MGVNRHEKNSQREDLGQGAHPEEKKTPEVQRLKMGGSRSAAAAVSTTEPTTSEEWSAMAAQ